MEIRGNIVDVINRRIFKGCITIENGKISSVTPTENVPGVFILPGLTDAHVHIESSMLIPSEFARLAVVHGTVATVSDPHEIANVLGLPGIQFMISNGKKVPFRFYFGASSCVPATDFETSGARLGAEETEILLADPSIKYLSEMMNFPGVLYRDPLVLKKLEIAARYGKPVDGHAPGLRGKDAETYAGAGITTDHECFSLDEAVEKIKYGMKILIREGSAARNFEALSELFRLNPDMIMLCSDDRHPDDLAEGHINLLVKRAIAKGYDLFDVFRSCTLNPALHYGLDTGLLRVGDNADLIIADNLKDFNILQTIVGGIIAAENGRSFIEHIEESPINNFNTKPVIAEDLRIKAEGKTIRVIEAIEGELITKCITSEAKVENGYLVPDPSAGLLKIIVKNRYSDSPVSKAFVKGFGLKHGAIASSVAHDSHNIIAVGCSDEEIAEAVNLVVASGGGISVAGNDIKKVMPLPFAGIMSGKDGYEVAALYSEITKSAGHLGSNLKSPFMTLSFMALLVIPELKISDKGLFDGRKFGFIEIS